MAFLICMPIFWTISHFLVLFACVLGEIELNLHDEEPYPRWQYILGSFFFPLIFVYHLTYRVTKSAKCLDGIRSWLTEEV